MAEIPTSHYTKFWSLCNVFWDPDFGMLNLETHRLALAIAKKTLDENRFTATQKTMTRDKPAFQIGDSVYFKNKQPGKWDLK